MNTTDSSSPRTVKTKICGTTSVEDARMVEEACADYIGIVVGVEFSPRCLSVEQALPICQQVSLPVVILVFNWDAQQIREAVETLRPHAVQLLGLEPPSLVKTLKGAVDCELWKSTHFPPEGSTQVNIEEVLGQVGLFVEAGIDAILIDTVIPSSGQTMRYGGTGKVNDWAMAKRLVEAISVPTFLAGGINPENVQRAIEEVRPYGVDLCSGVEADHGKRDPEKLRRLMLGVRKATDGRD